MDFNGVLVIWILVLSVICFFLVLNAIWIRHDYWESLKAMRHLNTRLEKLESVSNTERRRKGGVF